MVVPQHVLNWLYSVLTSEYHDVNRTYNDVAQALAQYPSLSPRTDVHTFPDGTSALLLHLSGTIPVVFRGATYRFPISLWVPHAYPRQPPLVYVTPTETMMVRPGQHVDPQGQVYHPYLVGWATFWDKSTILDFLGILQDVFAKEPPVVARQQGPPQPRPAPTPPPPPVPPLPPDLAPRPANRVQSATPESSNPPPPPPKQPQQPQQTTPQSQPSPAPVQGPPSTQGPPPPPPKVGGPANPQVTAASPPPVPIPTDPIPISQPTPSRYETAPPLPPPPAQPAAAAIPPWSPPSQHAAPPIPPPPPQYQGRPAVTGFPPAGPAVDPRISTFVQPQAHATPTPTWQQPPPPVQPQPAPKPPPPPNLLDDDPSPAVSSPSSAPPPPIPPNPEKDQLLHQLAQMLYAQRQKARAQNDASLQGLAAQRAAMLQAATKLQAESAQLTQLSALLTSNTAILQDSLRQADQLIKDSARLPAPDIDELLVAPTVVENQLYELVAEERALADAIFVLGRAVERGRVAPQTFAKMTRALAREWYLKKALVKKIGRGMGLEEH